MRRSARSIAIMSANLRSHGPSAQAKSTAPPTSSLRHCRSTTAYISAPHTTGSSPWTPIRAARDGRSIRRKSRWIVEPMRRRRLFRLHPAEWFTSSRRICRRRIVRCLHHHRIIDARLFAVDARTGKPCLDLGNRGFVDLTRGLGSMKPGWSYPTSGPLVARGHVIVGGWVSDSQSMDAPGSGVRTFDANNGKTALGL